MRNRDRTRRHTARKAAGNTAGDTAGDSARNSSCNTAGNTARLLLASMALTAGLAACSSAPITYHTLIGPATASQGAPADFAIAVAPVTIPEQLARPQLVVHGAADGSVQVLEQQQWVGPLDSELRDALALTIAARLRARDATRIDRPSLPVYRVSVAIRRFDAAPGSTSTVQASWRVLGPKDGKAVDCESLLQFAGAPAYPALVGGMRNAVAGMGEQIAATIAAMAGGGGGGGTGSSTGSTGTGCAAPS